MQRANRRLGRKVGEMNYGRISVTFRGRAIGCQGFKEIVPCRETEMHNLNGCSRTVTMDEDGHLAVDWIYQTTRPEVSDEQSNLRKRSESYKGNCYSTSYSLANWGDKLRS
ncbi:hypothetical protein RRG08_031227 [Elysia crispata]|uniref:Uncharacterized protein n=1 Tax=Elysia crispata TaxID=231223 RepID=A0AAE1AJX2_9GAST|nr:hypothetical protein RRG08_031227 [Elysia crispata]